MLQNPKIFKHDFKTHLIEQLEQQNTPDGRYYCSGDGSIKYPSITNMLSHFSNQDIMKWRNRVGHDEANKISRKASTRGTQFHKQCENYLLNKKVVLRNPLEQVLFINSLIELNKIDDIHLLETKLFSHHLRLAGTVDCVAKFNGKISVIDFKTSNRSKKKEWIESYLLQATAYAIMVEERTKIAVPNIVIIIAEEETMKPQIFVEKRDNFAKQLLSKRNEFEKALGIGATTASDTSQFASSKT
jgi:genome maintenance exonuclease 1